MTTRSVATSTGLIIGAVLSAALPIWPLWRVGWREVVGYTGPIWAAVHQARAGVHPVDLGFWMPGTSLTAMIISVCGLLGFRLHRILRRRQLHGLANKGRCLACGYNLTGNTSGMCPECGTAVKV